MSEILGDYDVAIVGFGPCGQLLAGLLGKRGHKVVVFERSPDRYPLPRAGHIDDEIMRFFQAVGIAGDFEARAITPRGYDWCSADGELLFRIPWNRATESTWRSDYIFYQPDLEELLDHAALKHPSVDLRRGWEVTGIESAGDHYEVDARAGDRRNGPWSPTGESARATARFVIGADGANSLVRRIAGIGFEDHGFEESLSIVDVRLNDPDMDIEMPDAGQICDPARPVSLFRWLGRRHCRWEFMLMPGEDPEQLVNEETSWDKLRQWGVTPENATLIRRTMYTFRSLIADTFRADGIILVGDAAHQMPPFLGQGMASGMRDVANVAWKLDLVLRGVADDAILDSYTEERRPHVSALTDIAIALGKVLCETDPERAAARDAAMLAGDVPPAPAFPALVGGLQNGSIAGGLGVQGRVSSASVSGRLEDVVKAQWRVLTRKRADRDRIAHDYADLWAALDAAVVHVSKAEVAPDSFVDRDGLYSGQFEAYEADVIICRPDLHIYAAVGAAASDEVISKLASLLQLQPVG
jgi:2-polyprenyl-6-methoxyphenol hydroxylase-like FAD-dependent oxidoreductase